MTAFVFSGFWKSSVDMNIDYIGDASTVVSSFVTIGPIAGLGEYQIGFNIHQLTEKSDYTDSELLLLENMVSSAITPDPKFNYSGMLPQSIGKVYQH